MSLLSSISLSTHLMTSPFIILQESSERNTMELRETQSSPGPDSAGLHNQRALTQTVRTLDRMGERRSLLKEEKRKETRKLPVSLF